MTIKPANIQSESSDVNPHNAKGFFEKLIAFAIEQRWMVMLISLGVAIMGIVSYQHLPIDAVPDITNVQVQINSAAPGYSPLETEQRITYPVETAMAGLPNLEETRSISRYGLSQVTVVFKEGTDIYFARQLVAERIAQVKEKLPAGISAAMGPTATGLGEIVMWTVSANPGALKPDGTPYTAMDLREVQDWVIKPQLRNVPGVTEINTVGGYSKQYQIAPNLEALVNYGLTLTDILNALEKNTNNQGAGYIEKSGEQYLIRVPGQITVNSTNQTIALDALNNIVLETRNGTPIRVQDVASASIGSDLRTGAATMNGEEVVLGTVFMLMGENSRTVSQAVAARLAEVNKTLPAGITANIVYDRTILIDKAISTVKKNLLEGALLVIAVLFVFLGNIRAAIITMCVIPLAMLMTFTGMVGNKVSANLMSLGALDFGIIIDGAVVIVENAMRRLAHTQGILGRNLTRQERFTEVFSAAREARRPLIYGQLIIMAVYLPIFALTGVEGKMFHPMAFTVVIALIAAMIISVTFIPAAIALFVTGRVQEKENKVMQMAKKIYTPVLDWTLINKAVVLVLAVTIVVLSGLLLTRMGSEFVPSLDEGDITLHALRIPGTSLSQAVVMQQELEKTIKTFPQVDKVYAKLGTAEIATDPMPPSVADTYLILKPRNEWPDPSLSKNALIAQMQAAVAKVPGNNYEFTQPIQMRFNELISGVRSDVAVKVFGDDLAQMTETAEAIANVLEKTASSADVKVEQTTGLPILTVNIDREKIARLGVNMADIQEAVSIAMNGAHAGAVYDGDRRFDIVVRLDEAQRKDTTMLERLPIKLNINNAVTYMRLGELASLDVAQGANQFSRANGKRNVVVTANVRERDIGTFVAEAKSNIAQSVTIPAGNWLEWGGTFKQLQSAANRLQIVIPLTLIIVFMLLYAVFGNFKDGLIVFSGIPFALTGGVTALWLTGIPLSISAGVGFIALSGVAVLNGLVMITFINNLGAEGKAVNEAVREGALARLRPILMTALVASFGFIPMAIATGVGAEVQRPLATVVIGGILSSTLLTLLVLPLLYTMVHREHSKISV
ncbi:efflux RND transporter permease subunit [Methylotenera sp.]|uniref:efflux RND transporter permease subunit n=1 Tax=Methylotenera sp. TaxID=2051956 RepID=UPI00273170A5|nr:CusA/CzcA family heavy metal efflux RND transporter [Methylotenera sp.]MDP2072365.1 CusA/CzcA family heavy metal efflux RND transporter [Methylotenera sp.]MDP3005608.1 CusA/CzcA family heavy metal efflux RND transporter [Methylotenera sp.]